MARIVMFNLVAVLAICFVSQLAAGDDASTKSPVDIDKKSIDIVVPQPRTSEETMENDRTNSSTNPNEDIILVDPLPPKQSNNDQQPKLHRVPLFSMKSARSNFLNHYSDIQYPSNIEQSAGEGFQSCSTVCSNIVSDKEDSIQKACVHGCRFYFLHNMLAEKNGFHSDEERRQYSHENCLNSCKESYEKDVKHHKACVSACDVLAHNNSATEKESAISHDENEQKVLSHRTDQTEREDSIFDDNVLLESDQQANQRKPFSIIIPILRGNNHDESKVPFSVRPPASLFQMMLSMMKSMNDRAQQMIHQQQPSSFSSLSEQSNDGQGDNSISVQRSMSIMVSNDNQGHKKIVVMNSLPKVFIHRFGSNPLFGDQSAEDNSLPIDSINRLKELVQQEEGDEMSGQNGDRMVLSSNSDSSNTKNNRFFVRFGSHDTKDGVPYFGSDIEHRIRPYNSDNVGGRSSYWPNCLNVLLPRLLYLSILVLMIYTIFWIFYAIPNYLYDRRSALATTGTKTAKNGKDKTSNRSANKFFFTNPIGGQQKYFQLNNNKTTSSTTGNNSNSVVDMSTPPPYSDTVADCEAGPLPPKEPLSDVTVSVQFDRK